MILGDIHDVAHYNVSENLYQSRAPSAKNNGEAVRMALTLTDGMLESA